MLSPALKENKVFCVLLRGKQLSIKAFVFALSTREKERFEMPKEHLINTWLLQTHPKKPQVTQC